MNPNLTTEQQTNEKEAQQKRFGIKPTVTADQLVTGAEKINPPAPVVNTNDGSQTAGLVGATANNTQQFITSQSENARKRDEMAQLLGGQTFDASGQRQALTEQYGLPDTLTRLTDIQTQLSSANTASGLRKVNIESGGQGAIQGVRSLTQEDRENAVRNAGLAAEASVLQGNIETASTLINNAMQDYYSDRTLKNQNMIQQLDYFSKIADDETAQLLEQEKRKYEADQEAVKEVKDSIRTAMQNGATAQEMRQFTDPSIDDATKLALAQTITARGANEIRQMEMEQAELQQQATRASIAASQASTANIYDQIRARQTALREAVGQATTAKEAEAIKREADSDQALSIKTLASELLDEKGFGAAVGVGFKKTLVGAIPFVSGDAIAGTARADFEAKAKRLGNLLTIDNLKLMSGVLTDKDIEILASAGSNLGNFDISEKAYKEEVNRVIGVMDRTIDNNGITSEQAIFWGVLDENDVGTFNSLWETL